MWKTLEIFHQWFGFGQHWKWRCSCSCRVCITRYTMCHEEPKLCALVCEVPTSGTFTACSCSATVMRLAVCFSAISLGTCNFNTKAQFLKPILLMHKTVPPPSPPIPSQLIPSPMLPPTHTSFPSLSPRSHSKYPDAAVPSHVSAPAYAIQWSLTKALCSDINTKHTIGKKKNKTKGARHKRETHCSGL